MRCLFKWRPYVTIIKTASEIIKDITLHSLCFNQTLKGSNMSAMGNAQRKKDKYIIPVRARCK
jgi:hypothetical protein